MTKKTSFEANLAELEKMVSGLESGDMSLEESLKNFEKCVKYYKACRDYLSKAEKKIKVLAENLEEEDFD